MVEANPKFWLREVNSEDSSLYSLVGNEVADCKYGVCQSAVNIKVSGVGIMVFCLLHHPALPCLKAAVQHICQEEIAKHPKKQPQS